MSRRLRVAAAIAAGFSAFAGVVMLASLPTGTDRAEGVVPDDARLAARASLDDAVVLLLSRGGDLSVEIAYQGPKGWLGVPLAPHDRTESPDRSELASRVSTGGMGRVPALTAVYGLAPDVGARVTVSWADGTTDRARVAADRTWLVVRHEVSAVAGVTVRSADGVIAEVERL